MSSWINDAAAVQNHNGAAFNHVSDSNTAPSMLDPSAYLPNTPSFDMSQYQNQQLQQRMQNGAMRNGSPAFSSPVYQTSSVVPSKRPRPREDSMATSPRQGPGMLPNSRSHTPLQAPYPGYQPNSHAPQHTPQPNAYSHLQHNGGSNASPSPIMSNQMRPGAVPQRVATASPHPFSPAAQQFGPQASPSQSEHGSRVETPQSHPYMQNPAFAPNYNPAFAPQPGRPAMAPQGVPPHPMQQPNPPQQHMYQQPGQPPSQNAQQQARSMEQQRLINQMRMQQQLQKNNLMSAQRAQNPHGANTLAQSHMQTPNGQFAQGVRPQQKNNMEQFLQNLTSYMQSKNFPLDLNPMVGDRPISLVNLYLIVTKLGGFRRVTQGNGWAQVAQALQLPLQNPGVLQQLRSHYERYLARFEQAWAENARAKALMANANQNVAAGPSQAHISPTKHMNIQGQPQQNSQYMQQLQHAQQSQHMPAQSIQGAPARQMTPMHSGQQPLANGFGTPQAQTPSQPANQLHSSPQPPTGNEKSRSIDQTPPARSSFSIPSPVPSKSGNIYALSPNGKPLPLSSDAQMTGHRRDPTQYTPKQRDVDTMGGLDIDALALDGARIIQTKPNIPTLDDMGVIDVHALTMSLQSGIHAEVRVALDTLAVVTAEQQRNFNLDLRMCEDLVESLVDCAEVQVELLVENAAEVSDVMLVNAYEDVLRGCLQEEADVKDIPSFGSVDYEADRAVDRLIAVTSILRNLSFFDANAALLADEFVIRFLCIVIRHLGTRNMLLRSHTNTLDFMKDIVVFLSNLAHAIELPGKEQASCLLHFLLAFAPCPPPNAADTDAVDFVSFDPLMHQYLPPAVDSLAKLLARDEPNRTFYRAIFATDSASTPPYDLLTRTFGLAISPIPECQPENPNYLMHIVELRKPYLMQGMLAAEILVNLVPNTEHELARSWLSSEDGFAVALLQLVLTISTDHGSRPPPRGAMKQNEQDLQSMLPITKRGIVVLRRLAELSQQSGDAAGSLPRSTFPSQGQMLGALLTGESMDPFVLRQLHAYSSLDR